MLWWTSLLAKQIEICVLVTPYSQVCHCCLYNSEVLHEKIQKKPFL